MCKINNSKKIIISFFVLMAFFLFLYCDNNNSSNSNKNSNTSTDENPLTNSENESIDKNIIVNRFEILKKGNIVGEYYSRIDKNISVWKIEEETKLNGEIYKKAKFTFNSNAKIIPKMKITTYTERSKDVIDITRDNKKNEYNVKYIQNEQEASNTFVDTENTYIVNITLFAAYEIVFQILQPINSTMDILNMIPVLNSLMEVKITKLYEDKLNINNNIIDCIVFEVVRAGDKQKVWLNKNNYKILRIKTSNNEIEVRRVLKNKIDDYALNEKNIIAGEKNFSTLIPYESDNSENNGNNGNNEDNEEIPSIKVIELDEDDIQDDVPEYEEGELIESVFFDEESRVYEFFTSSGIMFGYNYYTLIDSENFYQIVEQTELKTLKGPTIENNNYKISYIWNKEKDRMMSYNASFSLGKQEKLVALSERANEIYMITDSDAERRETHLKDEEMNALYFHIPYSLSNIGMLLKELDYSLKMPLIIKTFFPEKNKISTLKINSAKLQKGGAVDTTFQQLKLDINCDGVKQYIYLNNNDKSIYKIDIPSENFVIRLSDKKKMSSSDLNTEDILNKIYVKTKSNNLSSVTINDYLDFDFIGAEILINGESPFDKKIEYYLDNKFQSFDGSIKNNKINGIVEINKIDNTIFPSDPYPVKELPKAIERYTLAETNIVNIPVDNETIKITAGKVVQDADTIFNVGKLICEWVYKNIKYSRIGKGSIETFLSKKGDSGAKSQLTIAMLRSLGIPSRVVGGLLYGDLYHSNYGQHYWVEIYLGKNGGWIMMDPTIGETNSFSPLHISLWRWENIVPCIDSFIDIAIIEKE